VVQLESMWRGYGGDVEGMWSKWSPSGVQVGVWGSVKYRLRALQRWITCWVPNLNDLR
jgi:hypothetical protein